MDTKALEAKIENLERRLANVEEFVRLTLERRSALGLSQLDDPLLQPIVKDAVANAIAGWKDSRWTSDVRAEERRRILAERERLKLMAAEEEKQAAEDAATVAEVLGVLEFYREHGHAPSGYTIIDEPATQ